MVWWLIHVSDNYNKVLVFKGKINLTSDLPLGGHGYFLESLCVINGNIYSFIASLFFVRS